MEFEKILVSLVLLFAVGECALSTVIVADRTMSRMIELTARKPYCTFHSDRDTIQRMILASDKKRLRQMSNEAISALVDVCLSKKVTSMHQGGFIYPGTNWCGPGNVAANYSDLGVHEAEDRCCREHDHCPNTLESGQCRQSICNSSPFTRSHCDCDAKFRRCLQDLNTEVANTIGAIFFNVVQVTCFKERRPCSQWQRNGYDEEESDVICSEWKYRPSEKYIPLMPLPYN